MKRADLHPRENERLEELKSYSILDTLPEEEFDRLTRIAAFICDCPISLVSLIDDKRQWFKSKQGLKVDSTPKEYAFCAHSILRPNEIFVVENALEDSRFHDNPLVTDDPNIRFYAGVPLVASNNLPLGSLCVIDKKPKKLTENQLAALQDLADQTVQLFKLRKKQLLLNKTKKELKARNKDLENFAYKTAHDIKSPLNNISALLQLFTEEYADYLDEEANELIEHTKSSSSQLSKMVDGMLEYAKASNVADLEFTPIQVNEIEQELETLLSDHSNLFINVQSNLKELFFNRSALDQILINLCVNSIKHNNKKQVSIDIEIGENSTHYAFTVRDNGPGIDEADQSRIFELYFTGNEQKGNGIGLATVKKIVEIFEGEIRVFSKPNEGTSFYFTLKKQAIKKEEQEELIASIM